MMTGFVAFPEGIFQPDTEKELRRIFGYIK
jgi:hypothetical protein